MRRMAFVPEGRCDRSLARVPGTAPPQKSRPVGYGMIRAGVRTDTMIGVAKFRVRKLNRLWRIQALISHWFRKRSISSSSSSNIMGDEPSRRVLKKHAAHIDEKRLGDEL
jgi:hypothetical protein